MASNAYKALTGITKRNLTTSHHPLETLVNSGLAICEVWKKNLTKTSHEEFFLTLKFAGFKNFSYLCTWTMKNTCPVYNV